MAEHNIEAIFAALLRNTNTFREAHKKWAAAAASTMCACVTFKWFVAHKKFANLLIKIGIFSALIKLQQVPIT